MGEKRVLSLLFNEMAKDTGKYCFGAEDTMSALEDGLLEILILWEDLELKRIQLSNEHTGTQQLKYATPEASRELVNRCPETGVELTQVSSVHLAEWIINNHKLFNTRLELITDTTSEGSQFCEGL